MAAIRPPPGIGARTFFERWLPETFASLATLRPGQDATVRVTLSGAEGGDWWVRLDTAGLTVERVPPGRYRGPDPDVWVRQPLADFLAVFDPHPDLPELLPPGWSVMDLLFLDSADIELARRIDGRILIEIAGRRRRRFSLDLAFGTAGAAAGRPRATVRLDGALYEGLRTGEVAPLQALLEGRLSIEGDRSLAMQALLLSAARLGRGHVRG